MKKSKDTKASIDAKIEEVLSTNILPKSTDLEKAELKGPVKQVKETFYKAKRVNGETVAGAMDSGGDDDKNILANYNEKGMRTEIYSFSMDGRYFKATSNEKGLSNGHISYKPDGSAEVISTHIYDKQGFQIEDSAIYADGRVLHRTYYTNDEQGRAIEYKQFNGEGKMTGLSKNIYYDNNTHLHEYYNYNVEAVLQHKWTYLYDDQYNMLERHDYDAAGNLTESEFPKYKIDHLGKRVSTEPSDKFYKQHSYRKVFENDTHGNWIKKIIYFKNAAMNIAIRDITYYDDASKENELEIFSNIAAAKAQSASNGEVNKAMNVNPTSEMNEEQIKWMTEGTVAENFPLLRYYVLKNKEFPSQFAYAGSDCESFFLQRELIEKLDGRIINTYVMDRENSFLPSMIRYTLSFLDGKYLLNASQIQERNEDNYYVPDMMYGLEERRYSQLHTSQLSMLHPSTESGKRDYGFEAEVLSLIDLCKLYERPAKPEIYMVQVSGGNYSLVGHSIDDSFEIKDLNLNYGQGFEDFHDELMDRFENENKGLVLFHGEPGTGKTYYIRHLLRSMANKNKIVIYMPPNMVDYMVEPAFMSFISQEVQQFSEDDNFCVLLIEDAEPLLASRSSDTRIQGVSNLLNMTDGLLNDMLNIQIICTFNVKVSKLDKALLRPGRLLARKEFKALPELEANILASRLGIKHHFTAASTLAEIYAMVKSKNTLIHDVE